MNNNLSENIKEQLETPIINDKRKSFNIPYKEIYIEYLSNGCCSFISEYGDEIIRLPSNLKTISTWNEWKDFLKKNKCSKYGDLYRIIKEIFAGHISLEKDDEDEYNEKYLIVLPTIYL